ncbi:MAG: alpha/beta fold hydrolase [Mycobacteriales bacterium]
MTEPGVGSTLILADGQQIACGRAGSGPDVVCVPGGPARASSYLGDLGGLTAHRTLHLVDNRGSGGSRPAEAGSISTARQADDLVEIVGLLGLDRPALLCHSYGTRVVALALARRPDLASAVVLVTPAPIVVDLTVFSSSRSEILEARAEDPAYAEAVEAARAIPTARPRDMAFLEQASIPLWYGTWGPAQQAHAARQREEVDVRAAMTLRNDAARWSPPDLSAVEAPVLVVAGALDFLTPPAAAHAVHELFAHSTYAEIEGAGHFPWLDDPDTFATVVDDFLAGVALT